MRKILCKINDYQMYSLLVIVTVTNIVFKNIPFALKVSLIILNIIVLVLTMLREIFKRNERKKNK